MRVRGLAPGLPLLAKELAEQAARRRTYVIRGAYALLLCGFTLFLFWDSVYRDATGPSDIFYHGPELFDQLLLIQLTGIYLFMPALMSGVICGEKERSTLGLLLLTRLRPWAIVMEKFLSRQVAMGTFLLMAVPPLMFCYTIGGLNVSMVASGIWLLVVTALQVGAVALACSAYCRTTMQSYIGTYLVLGLLAIVGPLLSWMLPSAIDPIFSLTVTVINAVVQGIVSVVDYVAGLFGTKDIYGTSVPRFVYGPDLEVSNGTMMGRLMVFGGSGPVWMGSGGTQELPLQRGLVASLLCPAQGLFRTQSAPSFVQMFSLSLPTLLSALTMLFAARWFLVRRAFAQPKNWLLKLFRSIDRFFQHVNKNQLTRGIVLTRENTSLPDLDPIVWRETQKKSLGTVRYLVRVLLVLEFPTAFICSLMLMFGAGTRQAVSGPLAALTLFLWSISAILVAVRSSGLIAGERQRETLDVLLSSPLWCSEIISQKMRGVRRLLVVLATPLITCILSQTYWRYAGGFGGYYGIPANGDSAELYFVVSLLCVAIQLPMAAWIGVFFSLRVKSQSRAILSATLAIVAWVMLGLFAVDFVGPIQFADQIWQPNSSYIAQVLCPPLAIVAAENGLLTYGGGFAWWLPCMMMHGLLTWLFAAFVRARCARWLGRAEL
jgi:ABC-type transport system involved in multi-copper enzyme maturation permease subunit